ncbi:MAG: neutral/alkaline non-lysosomal ceramidase N-terminal domain-containing protein [SAR324 cluster bacterium]|nr:neutral/alkaline non-lysosomal ceramidase N-terminal domain-containing protein [SAR324 cluster bacterium]
MTSSQTRTSDYEIGVGKQDITGNVLGLGMMGYGTPEQKTWGIQLRLWSRAFIMRDTDSGKRVVFVCADLCFISQSIKLAVIRKLRRRFEGLYDHENVMITATHTHSGPGGYSHYPLYNITTWGFSSQNFRRIVNGIFQSVITAHRQLKPGLFFMNRGELTGISVNRSPEAYRANPDSIEYPHDTNKEMTVCTFTTLDAKPVGVISWYAIHPTSTSKNNRYISGDSKGYAAWRFEKEMREKYKDNSFVAAFANSEHGDTSPNIRGDGMGEGKDDLESTEICGFRQFEKAWELFEAKGKPVTGPLDFRHRWVKMPGYVVAPEFTGTTEIRLPTSALGVSFAAGASQDGPSDVPGIQEGLNKGKTWTLPHIWKHNKGLSAKAIGTATWMLSRLWDDPEHQHKPVILPTGISQNAPWTPQTLPFQIFQIGMLGLISVPGEMTTMCGRRLKHQLSSVLINKGIQHLVIAGLANTYTGYIETREAYALQHYEGASVHFGPYTFNAYQQIYSELSHMMAYGIAVKESRAPIFQFPMFQRVELRQRSLKASPTQGMVRQQPRSVYHPGEKVLFQLNASNPNDDLEQTQTYVLVERQHQGRWECVAVDSDWDTRVRWFQQKKDLIAEIIWNIPDETIPGIYRVVYQGSQRTFRDFVPYQGVSRTFRVTS